MKVIIEIEILSNEEDGEVYLKRGDIAVKSEGLTEYQMDSLAEVWGQSDWFYVDFNNEVIGRM